MSERSGLRLFVLRVLVLSLLTTLLARLWFLQVVDAETFTQAAADNRVREVVTSAARGQVLDVMGRPLVRNRTALVVSVDRSGLPQRAAEREAVLRRLAEVIEVPFAELSQSIRLCSDNVGTPCWSGSPYQAVPVKEDASAQEALRIEEHREDFPGVSADLQTVRDYPHDDLAAHLLGYVSPISAAELASPRYVGYRGTDLVGKAGVEQVYDADLRGKPGVRQVEVDRVGRVTGVRAETAATAGDNLVLGIDGKVQALVEKAVRDGIALGRSLGGTSQEGVAVVVDPRDGQIVAMASSPTYDPSVFTGGISTKEYSALQSTKAGLPLLSRATQGEYAPASTFKVVSSASAMATGQATPSDYFSCPGSLMIGNSPKTNFDSIELGTMNLHEAIVKSCDTIYYRFAVADWQRDNRLIADGKKPAEHLQTMARAFGFGSDTGIDLPDESAGRIVDRAFKERRFEQQREQKCAQAERGYPDVKDAKDRSYFTALAQEFCLDGDRYNAGEHANLAIGQGETVVTPLQLAMAYSAMVNGGTLWEPRLAKAVLGPDGSVVREIEPTAKSQLPLSGRTLSYLREAFGEVPTEGTARAAFDGFDFDALTVGGKTGTAQVNNEKSGSWFVGFAPVDKPRYVVVALFPDSDTGGTVAAPAVRQILEGIYGLGGADAALPDGAVPTELPRILPDGTAAAPGSKPAGPAATGAPG